MKPGGGLLAACCKSFNEIMENQMIAMIPTRRLQTALRLCLPALALICASAAAQQWPAKTVRIIVPFPPGQAADLVARVMAERLSAVLGQQVIVENRPGAGSVVGSEMAAKSPPDGYTFLAGGTSALVINPHLYAKLGYDTLRDFAPITQTATNTFGLVINPVLPVKSVKDLVAIAKSRPNELSFASFGIGNQTHLGGELFAQQIGIRMLHVPYKGETPAVIDLLSGQIALIFSPMQGVVPHIRTGKLKLLATCGVARAPAFPEAPSMTEAGFKTVVITGWTGLLAPTGTPRDIVDKLQKEIAARLLAPETRESMSKQGAEPVASTPDQFMAVIKAEMTKWSAVIKTAGLEATQ